MMAKSIISLEVEKNSKTFSFHMPVGVNYGDAYDAAFQVLEDILALMQQAKDAAKPKTADSSEPVEAELA